MRKVTKSCDYNQLKPIPIIKKTSDISGIPVSDVFSRMTTIEPFARVCKKCGWELPAIEFKANKCPFCREPYDTLFCHSCLRPFKRDDMEVVGISDKIRSKPIIKYCPTCTSTFMHDNSDLADMPVPERGPGRIKRKVQADRKKVRMASRTFKPKIKALEHKAAVLKILHNHYVKEEAKHILAKHPTVYLKDLVVPLSIRFGGCALCHDQVDAHVTLYSHLHLFDGNVIPVCEHCRKMIYKDVNPLVATHPYFNKESDYECFKVVSELMNFKALSTVVPLSQLRRSEK